MITMLICNCHNGPVKAYKFLEPIVENWIDVPMHRGREECNKFLDSFQDYGNGPSEISKFMMEHGKYIIVVGWDSVTFRWADISHGQGRNQADAELIVRKFA